MQSLQVRMRKRIFSAVVIVLSVASIAVATFVAQRAAQRAKPSTSPAASGQTAKGKTPANRNASTAQAPLRAPDPNRAPQAAVDDALYANEEFFGTQTSVARPYATALERVDALL